MFPHDENPALNGLPGAAASTPGVVMGLGVDEADNGGTNPSWSMGYSMQGAWLSFATIR